MDNSPVLDWTGIDPDDKLACEKVRRRAYNQRPHVKLRRAAYRKEYRKRPIAREARRLYRKRHRQQPEVKERMRLYRQRPEVKEKGRLYRQRPEVKEKWNRYMRNYIKSYAKLPHVKAYHKAYLRRPKAKAHYRRYQRLYCQTPKGKLILASHGAKHRAKGFTPLCPNIWNCPVDYHHVSPSHSYVVPLPRKVHRAINGRTQFHFAFNASMICLLYGLNILGGL